MNDRIAKIIIFTLVSLGAVGQFVIVSTSTTLFFVGLIFSFWFNLAALILFDHVYQYKG